MWVIVFVQYPVFVINSRHWIALHCCVVYIYMIQGWWGWVFGCYIRWWLVRGRRRWTSIFYQHQRRLIRSSAVHTASGHLSLAYNFNTSLTAQWSVTVSNCDTTWCRWLHVMNYCSVLLAIVYVHHRFVAFLLLLLLNVNSRHFYLITLLTNIVSY